MRTCSSNLEYQVGAEIYGVGTKVLKQAVKRNLDRFPEDFMFEMTKEELEIWRSQIVTSSWGGQYFASQKKTYLCFSKVNCFPKLKTKSL